MEKNFGTYLQSGKLLPLIAKQPNFATQADWKKAKQTKVSPRSNQQKSHPLKS